MITPRPLVLLFHRVAVLACISVLGQASLAQLIGGSDIQSSILQRQLSTASSFTGSSAPLEGPVDPDSYLVGPGDGFELSIGGMIPLSQRITVSAGGTLVVPDVGSFYVADRTLRSVRNEVRSALRRHFRNVNTDIVLAEPRQFYVHVSGAVLVPGRHIMNPIARVEDALVAAMGGVSPQQLLSMTPSRQALAIRAYNASEARAPEPGNVMRTNPLIPEAKYLPAFRNVLVTHRDGTVDRVDILQYYATGSIAANPYLRDGDAVSLQFFNPAEGSIGIAGAVPEPGVYDYRPDDTALSILTLALGPEAASAGHDVRLFRSTQDGMQAQILQPFELASTALEQGDRLFVLPRDRNTGMVEIVGATHFPSSYPIRVGETTLTDLLEMAGGLLPDALVRGAYLERRPRRLEPAASLEESQLALEPTLRNDIRESAISSAAFDLTRLSTLSYVEKRYLAREFLDKQRVSIDFEAALREGAPPIYLQDGDRVVVPFDLNSVYVFGQVPRPGHIPYVSGQSVEQYIASAGGRAAGATDTYVLTALGAVVPADQAGLIDSGDLVFVNRLLVAEDRGTQSAVIQQRNMELAEERARSDARFRIISAVLSTITATALLINVFINTK
ncbi:MAG: SLBB domain-containing protein [Bacteroidetes bacterium]|nr:SLBB domain-containing protein [Bacteroidota bacterium]